MTKKSQQMDDSKVLGTNISDTAVNKIGDTLTSLASFDTFSLVIFVIVMVASVWTGSITGNWVGVGLLLLAGLVFYHRYTGVRIAQERLAIERERNQLIEKVTYPQLSLPLEESRTEVSLSGGTQCGNVVETKAE